MANKLFSLLDQPQQWAIVPARLTVPAGLRYAGTEVPGVKATQAAAGALKAPCDVMVRRAPSGAKQTLEIELLPFTLRRAAQELPFGLPVLYAELASAAGAPPAKTGLVTAGDTLASAQEVILGAVFPDGMVRDPLLWAGAMQQAFQSGGCDVGDWGGLAARLEAQVTGTRPLLTLDHCGQPLKAGRFQVKVGNVSHQVDLVPGDGGDLAQAYARLNAGPLWGNPILVKPVAPGGALGEYQLVHVETGDEAQDEIAALPARRHILVANLLDWYAAQQVPGQWSWYTRHNRVTPLVNGREFFKDIFSELANARGPGGGFHLAGWGINPGERFVEPAPAGAPDTFRSLKEVAKLVDSCYLGAKFIQPEPGAAQGLEGLACFILLLGFGLVSTLSYLKVDRFRTDAAGSIVLVAAVAGAGAAASILGDQLLEDREPNKGAMDAFAEAGSLGKFLYGISPATVADNLHVRQALAGAITALTKHFSVYHQKLAVVRTTAGQFVGYCGGIDFDPNRKDDANHLIAEPFHDVHARVEGPAVRELALTFQERWQHANAQVGNAPAKPESFAPPTAAELHQPGHAIVQVARTYFKAADQARQLPFAPGGDRTLLNTLLCAIRAARRFIYLEDQYLTPCDGVDFSDALVKKVQDGEIARLIIAIPGANDQLFGQLVRGPFVQKLYDSQKTPGIVRVGCPRRRYTVPRCDLRASSGKLLLSDDLPNNLGQISLAPKARIPSVPFWVAVDGELMYAYKEEAPVRPTVKTFAVYRGQDTLLVSGNPKQGTLVRDHKAGAAATVVELRDIYVHAKVLIVDDVFASIGSANVNRRGHYSDGECNIFVVPESLRADAANPVLALRKRLWAEMLDLPEGIVAPLLEDAITASELFERSWLLGNRFVPHHAYLPHVEALTNITVKTGDGVMTWIKDLAQIYATTQYEALFDNCVDPSSLLEP